MTWILPSLVSIFGTIFVAGTIIAVAKILKATAKIDLEPNAPIIDMTTKRQFTDGHCEGLVKSMKPRKNKTVLFEVYPTDSEQGENKPRPKIQSFVVAENMIKRIPRGDKSSRREYIYILSRTPADLPEKMRDSDFGKWLTKEGILGHLEKTFGVPFIRTGDEAIAEIMERSSRVGMTRSVISQMQEEIAEFRKIGPRMDQMEKKGLT